MFIIFTAILMIFGSAVINKAVNENNFSVIHENGTKAYYVARAGAEAAAGHIQNLSYTQSQISTFLQTNENNSTPTTFGEGEFIVNFSGTVYKPVIHSTGYVNGRSRTVHLQLKKRSLFGDSAITVKNNLYIKNPNIEVTGDIAFVGSADYTLGPSVSDISDVVTENLSVIEDTFTDPLDPGLDVLDGTETGDELNITNGDDYADHNLGSKNYNNSTLTITLTDDMKLQYDTLETKGTINVLGEGTLYIYVNNLDSKANLYTSENATTVFIVLDTGTVDFQTGNSTFEANIYGPNAEVTVRANCTGMGSILANNIILESGAEIHYDNASGGGDVYAEDLDLPTMGYIRDYWNE